MYFCYYSCSLSQSSPKQAEEYWKRRPQQTVARAPSRSSSVRKDGAIMSDFDCHHQSLLKKGTGAETCGVEVRRYLKDVEEDVTKDSNIIKWWQVCRTFIYVS